MADAPPGRVLFLIPARGGSRGIPAKNLQKVDGVSLVARAAICAHRFLREVPLPEARLVVDTDSPEIAAEARNWHAEVPFLRSASFAQDHTTTVESTLHLLDQLADQGWPPDTIVLLQPTSPLRSWSELNACWQTVQEGADSVVTVVDPGKPPQLAMELGAGGILNWLRTATPPPANVRRQDLPLTVAPSGAVYITRTAALREHGAFIVPGVTVGVQCDVASSGDIDTPSDLVAARRDAVLATSPALVTVASLAGVPAAGGFATLSGVDGRLRVVQAATLPAMISDWKPQMDVRGVLVLAEPGSPGPAVWREALGCPVALWCPSGTLAAELATVLGAADAVAVPEEEPEVGELVRGLLRAWQQLRG